MALKSKVSWRDIQFVWADGSGKGPTIGDENYIPLMAEYRRTSAVFDWFMQLDGEDPADADCDTGPEVDEIDWEGFPA